MVWGERYMEYYSNLLRIVVRDRPLQLECDIISTLESAAADPLDDVIKPLIISSERNLPH